MELINPQLLSKRKLNELIQSLGGKYTFWERLKLRGIGIGGLELKIEENPDIPLKYKEATESVKVSIEPLKKGLILSFNNTKELKWYVAHNPKMNIQLEKRPLSHQSRATSPPLEIRLMIQEDLFILHTSGWNNKSVVQYFQKLPALCTQSHQAEKP
jgi:hypothetical protein